MKVRYRVNGKIISRKEFCALPDNLESGEVPNITKPWNLHSRSVAVHPKRRREAEEYARKCGVPTEHDHLGCPVFKSLRHQRKYLRSISYHNEDDVGGGPPGKVCQISE